MAIVDQWPAFASAGTNSGVPTAGWAYADARAIRIPGAPGAKETTVMGDQVRVALEGTKGPSSGIMRFHCSPGIDSLRVTSFRAGLFNLAVKQSAASR